MKTASWSTTASWRAWASSIFGSTPRARESSARRAAFEEWLQCEYTRFRSGDAGDLALGQCHGRRPNAWEWLAAAGFAVIRARRDAAYDAARRHFDGVPLRVLRASFSGELGYEVNVPADQVEWLLERCGRAPRNSARCPTASRRWRYCAPKRATSTSAPTRTARRCPGHGFRAAIGRKAANFVGRRSLLRPAARDPERLQLVALARSTAARAAGRRANCAPARRPPSPRAT